MEQTTPKQLNILLLLYRFRFLNRIQIQKLLNHKDPRRINTWLKDLTGKTIIGRHYSTKLKENTKPAIYYLMTKSKSLLIDQNGVDNKLLLKRIYREKIRKSGVSEAEWVVKKKQAQERELEVMEKSQKMEILEIEKEIEAEKRSARTTAEKNKVEKKYKEKSEKLKEQYKKEKSSLKKRYEKEKIKEKKKKVK